MAAPTVNQRIQRASLRHQADIQRYATGTANEIIRILNRADADLVATIRARLEALGPVEQQIFGQGKDTTERLQAILEEVRALNAEAYAAVGAELPARLRDLAVREAAWAERAIADALPITLSFTRPDTRKLAALVESAPFKGKFLAKVIEGMEADRAAALEAALQDGVAQGEGIDLIMRRIVGSKSVKGALQASREEAEVISRTYVNHVSNAARSAFHRENEDIVKGEIWTATLDHRTCSKCGSKDGKYYPLGKAPAIPAHYQCRCTFIAVLRSWRDMGIDLSEFPDDMRAALDGAVPGKTTYNEWLRGETAAVQDRVLGKKRGAWFRANPDKHQETAWAMSFAIRRNAPLDIESIN